VTNNDGFEWIDKRRILMKTKSVDKGKRTNNIETSKRATAGTEEEEKIQTEKAIV
jgi:hypothetical protein